MLDLEYNSYACMHHVCMFAMGSDCLAPLVSASLRKL